MVKLAVAVAAGAALVVGALVLRPSGNDPAPGDHLDVGRPSSLTEKRLPPGTKFVNTMASFFNRSPGVIVVRSVVSLRVEGGDRDEIVRRIELSPRSTGWVAGGTYRTYPPVGRSGGKCQVEVIRPVEGYRLPPEEGARIVVLYKVPRGADRWKVRWFRVTYEAGGRLFYQDVPWTQKGRIDPDAKPYDLNPHERRCRHLARVVFWPGSE